MALMKAQRCGPGLKAERLAALVLATSDVTAATKFYSDVFQMPVVGSDILPSNGPHFLLEAGPNQWLALARSGQQPDLTDTGVHHAFRVNPDAKVRIEARLAAKGIEIERYKEDRSVEAEANYYFTDADGNRIQIVPVPANSTLATHGMALDHNAILAFDMLWAEDYYVQLLGLPVEGRVGWSTSDHARARLWDAGEEYMAPGTRRLDKLYMTMGGKNEVPRANMQLFLTAGTSTLVIYLATRHLQEPPETECTGSPRTLIWAPRSELDRVAAILHASGRSFKGPVEHGQRVPYSASLYMRDPSGNFLELCSR